MAKQVECYIVGLDKLLRELRQLPKELTAELRLASLEIAERRMVPAWKAAAIVHAGKWGPKIAATIRAKPDRLPVVQIGYGKKIYSGGASTIMTRYQANAGKDSRAGRKFRERTWAPFGDGTHWMEKVLPYQPAAIREWGQAVDRVVLKWNSTP